MGSKALWTLNPVDLQTLQIPSHEIFLYLDNTREIF